MFKHKAYRIISAIVFAALIGAYLIGLGYEDKIDKRLNLRLVEVFNKGDVAEIGRMTVHFMDIGQGDSCLIELPDGKTVLIDAGENDKKVRAKLNSYIAEVNEVRHALNIDKIERLDYAVATHSHSDHVGGFASATNSKGILESYRVGTFYRPNDEATGGGFSDPALALSGKNAFWGTKHGAQSSDIYRNVISAAYARCDEVIVTNPADNTQNTIKPSADLSKNDELYYEINFYGHKDSYYAKTNNYCPVIILEYQNRRIAVSGDAEKMAEEQFVALADEGAGRYGVFKSGFAVDIIKLGHHGSETASNKPYLSKLAGDNIRNIYLVISVGKNSYTSHLSPSHPHQETLNRLKEMEFLEDRILRTDECGDIVFGLVLYGGEDKAVIEVGGIAAPEITYPVKLFGVEIRYRSIGAAVLVLAALALFAPAFIAARKR